MTFNLLASSNPLEEGLFTFLLGAAVVFVGMLIIVLFVSLVGKAMNAPSSSEPKAEKKAVEVVPVQTSAPAPAVCDGDIPEDVRVAIIAAIAMYYENNNQPNHEFRVRKIKKLRN